MTGQYLYHTDINFNINVKNCMIHKKNFFSADNFGMNNLNEKRRVVLMRSNEEEGTKLKQINNQY